MLKVGLLCVVTCVLGCFLFFAWSPSSDIAYWYVVEYEVGVCIRKNIDFGRQQAPPHHLQTGSSYDDC